MSQDQSHVQPTASSAGSEGTGATTGSGDVPAARRPFRRPARTDQRPRAKATSDDDVWVFMNGKMTVDLGGLHPAMLGMVSLDASATMLGIQKGSVYSLDLFHAERHTDKSTFRIDTNLSFVNCGTVEAGGRGS